MIDDVDDGDDNDDDVIWLQSISFAVWKFNLVLARKSPADLNYDEVGGVVLMVTVYDDHCDGGIVLLVVKIYDDDDAEVATVFLHDRRWMRPPPQPTPKVKKASSIIPMKWTRVLNTQRVNSWFFWKYSDKINDDDDQDGDGLHVSWNVACSCLLLRQTLSPFQFAKILLFNSFILFYDLGDDVAAY